MTSISVALITDYTDKQIKKKATVSRKTLWL